MNNGADEFDDLVNKENWGPYGPSAAQPVKTGLTKRGKIGVSVVAAVIAGGGILLWQDHQDDVKATEIQAQEIQYRRELLALEMQKELNKAKAANEKAEKTHDAAAQKQIDACVDADKGLIGKQLGVTYESVTEDCQERYGTSADTGADMEEAAASSDSGGGISPSVLLGIAVGGAVLVGAAANRGRRRTTTYVA
ncbi:hypothetical protein AB0G67_40495 [Streptomyces sp. NPDC021056]|uniref:hypothetical protein n=1 Tax=Streptomyces sp. NPDC021056 TaxID=3155012 RepID=UPI0033E7206E